MFQITDTATKQFKLASEQFKDQGMSLRISVRPTDKTGLHYRMGFDKPTDKDVEYNINDVPFTIDQESDKLIDGMVIDFRKFEEDEQFVFVNPNDTKDSHENCSPSTCESPGDTDECKSCSGG